MDINEKWNIVKKTCLKMTIEKWILDIFKNVLFRQTGRF